MTLQKEGESSMCGIIGYLSKTKKSIEEVFKEQSKKIVDRGVYFDQLVFGNEYYGYSRLPTDSVNDTTLNSIQSKDGKILLYNGLITNVDYLCEKYHLPSEAQYSDTLCLFYGFSRYKQRFLSDCRGMFAFAFITDNEVVLVRDTVGIKPLYFTQAEHLFAFASEIKSLPFERVEELLPGEIISYNKMTKRISKDRFVYKSYKKYSKRDFEICLKEAIVNPTYRYLSQSKDKKVGILLSGGVDSSILVKLLIDNLPFSLRGRLTAFCIGSGISNDVKTSQRLAKKLHLPLVVVEPFTPEDALSKLKDVVYKVESHHARVVRVALLQEALVKEIKKHDISILISGEGADELFFGYQRFIEGLLPHQTQELFGKFYSDVFFSTLLQRYERIFARSQIEGRVPFLDQEVIELALKYSVSEKVGYLATSYITKMPLRLLAKNIGLPSYIYQRKKEKMTHGATGKNNSEGNDGYLEKESLDLTGESFGKLVENYYYQVFPNIEYTKNLLTEEDLMKLTVEYCQQNTTFSGGEK